jgi:ATP-dependent Clp protease ATP-binding subunit ClpA
MIPILPADGDVTAALGHLHTVIIETGAREVRPEHMLVAMARYASEALKAHGDPVRLEACLLPMIEASEPDQEDAVGETPYSDAGRRILERAMADAEGEAAPSWGIDHLLGAVMAESPPPILEALREAGFELPGPGSDAAAP